MANSSTALNDLHPYFSSKSEMIAYIRQHIEPNCPAAVDILLRIIHTDLAGGLTGGATVTPSSYGL